jgi:hypothetical protein
VFSKEAFKTEAPKKFVLVELDYPQMKKLSDELTKQNTELAKRYRIKGYPTILLMEADGKVIAHTGYQEGGPEKYVKHLDEFIDIFGDILKMRTEIDKAQGLDRVKLLDKEADVYTAKLHNGDGGEVLAISKEIVGLDPDNKSGLKTQYQVKAVKIEFNDLTSDMKFVDAAALLKKGIAAIADAAKTKDLKEMLPQAELLAKAQETIAKLKPELENAKGLDRAKTLDKLIDSWTALGGRIKDITSQDVEKWSKEIIVLDGDNKAGLQAKYEFRIQMSAATRLLQTGKFADARTAIEKALTLPGLTGEQIQTGRFLIAVTYLNTGDGKNGLEQLQKALDAAPNGPRAAMIKNVIPQIKQQIEAAKAKEAEKDKK